MRGSSGAIRCLRILYLMSQPCVTYLSSEELSFLEREGREFVAENVRGRKMFTNAD